MFGKATDLDAGKDLSWQFNAGIVNVIGSRFLVQENKEFIRTLVLRKDELILHVVCSGYGGSRFEPNVPSMERIAEGVGYLAGKGFPVYQMVLRIDPVFPNEKGINVVLKVLDRFRSTGITRVRIRFIDFTRKIKDNFSSVFGKIPCNGSVNDYEIKNAIQKIREYGFYDYEICPYEGCLSNKDLFILKLGKVCNATRQDCSCLSGTTDLLYTKHCDADCIYCRR